MRTPGAVWMMSGTEWRHFTMRSCILVDLQGFGIPLLLLPSLLELQCVHCKECLCTVRDACDPSELSQQVQPHVWGVCGEWEWAGSVRDQLSHVEHPGLQNCFEGKGQPRVQTQQHEVFLNSLLTQEQEDLPADFPEDSGLLPGFKIHLHSCICAWAHDAEFGGILLRELSSTCKQGWSFYRREGEEWFPADVALWVTHYMTQHSSRET